MDVNKLRSILASDSEEILGVLGNNYIEHFLTSGAIGKGFAILSDERVYFKGKCLVRKGRGFYSKLEERVVDLNEITGTGFVHSRNIVFRILKFIFLGYGVPIFVIGVGCAAIPGVILAAALLLISGILFILDKAYNYSVFEISYAGGGIGFDLHFVMQEEAENFQKAIRQAKDKAKRRNFVYADLSKPSQADYVEELKKYKQLLDEGVITNEEFEAKKEQLLGL